MGVLVKKGEWVWHFHIGPDMQRLAPGWHVFVFVLGKMRRDIQEGTTPRQRDIWGVKLAFRFWLPVDKY